jgi:hypothetical protein
MVASIVLSGTPAAAIFVHTVCLRSCHLHSTFAFSESYPRLSSVRRWVASDRLGTANPTGRIRLAKPLWKPFRVGAEHLEQILVHRNLPARLRFGLADVRDALREVRLDPQVRPASPPALKPVRSEMRTIVRSFGDRFASAAASCFSSSADNGRRFPLLHLFDPGPKNLPRMNDGSRLRMTSRTLEWFSR